MTTQSEPDTNPAAPSGKPACADLPPVDAVSEPYTLKPKANTPTLEQDALPLGDGEQTKVFNWNPIYVGDCSLSNGSLEVQQNGTIFFSFGISSDRTDDAWVFYGGISLLNDDGQTLWTSQKISSQTCPFNKTEDWNGFLYYTPTADFEAVAYARINRAHC
jgi:hypothetical protein